MKRPAARGFSARFVALLLTACAFLLPGVAGAAPADEDLDVVARYVLGKAVARQAVNEVVVRIANRSSTDAAEGRVTVDATMSDSIGAEAAYRVEPNGVAYVHLPLQVSDSFTARVNVERDGVVKARPEIQMSSPGSIHVVDLAATSRLYVLSGVRIATPSSTSGMVDVDVDTPFADPATGELVLPNFAVGWAGVRLAVITSEQLSRIAGAELDALAGYVLAGGTLAVTVSREEDLRAGNLTKFIGGPAARALPRPEQLRPTNLKNPVQPRSLAGPPPTPAEGTVFSSWAGGNLEPSTLGAAAQYGLGRVILLGFDLGTPGVVDDLWVQYRFIEVLSMDAPTSLAVPGAGFGADLSWQARDILSDARGGGFGVALSAALLCAYAIVAGPVSFIRARRQNRPLRALLWLPLFSLGAFVLIVIIGLTSRGTGSRARRLTFIDLGAGMDRGVGYRYRSVLFPDSAAFEAAPERATNYLRPISSRRTDPDAVVHVDRDGVFLRGTVAPLETAIMRESGIFPLGAGISVSTTSTGDVVVRNRTGKTLKHVIVSPDDGPMQVFSNVAPEATVTAAARGATHRPPPYGNAEENAVEALLWEAGAGDDAQVFAAVASSLNPRARWLVPRVPVVLATFEETASKSDVGAPIQKDTTLVRVVGVGGEP